MTDKEILEATKAEIIRRLRTPSRGKRSGGYNALKSVLYFIKSKEREPENEDLKEEIKNFLDQTGAPFYWAGEEEQLEWVEIIAQHFADWQKRQIMKDAQECKVIEYYDRDICNYLTEIPHSVPDYLKDGDKVKLIIIKED